MADREISRDAKKERDGLSLETKLERLADRAAEQERRIERLVLVGQALSEILRDRLGLTPDEINEKINEIDLRDGVLDGKMRPQVLKCSTCGRPVSSARPKCVFCETVNKVDYVAW